jgi:protease-4
MLRRITLLVALLAIAAIIFEVVRSSSQIPQQAVLVVPLSGTIEERPARDWLERLRARGPALPTLLLHLEKARRDERVAAVVLRLQTLDAGFARLQELRAALTALAQSKPVFAWLDLGTLNATRELYLASAAKQIFVSPGYLGPVAGVTGQFLYLRGFLEKLGIAVEAERIGAYKSAPEMFTERGMSDAARQQGNEILDGVYAELVAGIAQGRALDPDAVRKLVDAAPGTAAELVDAKLADGVAQQAELLRKVGLENLEEITLDEYLSVDPAQFQLRTGPKIALVFAEGTIVPGGGVGLDSDFTPERIGGALDAAAEDEEIRAIVLRINSGGGSSQASEAIWQRVVAARQKKPVVVSMGDAAASGGYYVACGASSIVAQSTTLTGSIGIFFLRPSIETLLERLEIRSETIGRGSLSGIVLPDHRMSEPERLRMRTILRDQYQLFLQRVAAGRPLQTEEVDALGQGRIWLGGRAQEVKLVDALGGLSRAVDLAKEAAGIAPEIDPERVIFPAPQGLAEQLRSLTGGLGWAWFARRFAHELPDWLSAAATLEDAVYLPSFWVQFQ